MNMELTAAKLTAAAKLIRETAIQTMADKNGMSVDRVNEYLASGHEGALRQFKQLALIGAKKAVELHDQGAIALIA